MASTSPIVDLAAINDLQARMAALEAALGNYNAASAVLAAVAETGATGSSTSGAYNPITDVLKSGTSENFAVKTLLNNSTTGLATLSFGYTFTNPPIVIATAIGSDGVSPRSYAVTIGAVTTTNFQVRVTNINSKNQTTARVTWIAIGQ